MRVFAWLAALPGRMEAGGDMAVGAAAAGLVAGVFVAACPAEDGPAEDGMAEAVSPEAVGMRRSDLAAVSVALAGVSHPPWALE